MRWDTDVVAPVSDVLGRFVGFWNFSDVFVRGEEI